MSLISLLLRGLLSLLRRSASGAVEIENAMLKHQLKLLRRQLRRARCRPYDRASLAAAARILPRDRWASFLVTPRRCSGGIANSCGGSGPMGRNDRPDVLYRS